MIPYLLQIACRLQYKTSLLFIVLTVIFLIEMSDDNDSSDDNSQPGGPLTINIRRDLWTTVSNVCCSY